MKFRPGSLDTATVKGATVPANFQPPGFRLAKAISAIFHPFLLAPLTFAFLLYQSPLSLEWKLYYLFLILLAVDIIPFIAVYTLKRQGKTSSLDVPERQRRLQPFFISVGGYLLSWLMLWWLKAPVQVVVLMWIYAINTLIATLITCYWKISIHGMAFSGPVAALGWLINPHFFWLLLALPLIGFARVTLRAHSWAQVIVGFVLGFLLTISQMRILL